MIEHYVTKANGQRLLFGDNKLFEQVFSRPPQRPQMVPEYIAIREYMAAPKESRMVGMEMLVFLRNFRFATEEILTKYVAAKGLDSSLVSELVRTYFSKFLINRFYIADQNLGEMPEDAYVVYCLDGAGIYVLQHFSLEDSVSWLSTDSCMSVDLVSKYLTTAQFAAELYTRKGNSVEAFIPLYSFFQARRQYRFSAAVTIKSGIMPFNFVVESLRNFEISVIWPVRCGEKYGQYSQRNMWKRQFPIEPTYVLICEDEINGLRAAEILARQIAPATEDVNGIAAEIIVILDDYTAGKKDDVVFRYRENSNSLEPMQDSLFG